MIEIVDFLQMLTIQAAALDFVREDVEIESVGVLRRDQMHFPEREKDRHGNRDCGGEQQQTRPRIQRLGEKTKLPSQQIRYFSTHKVLDRRD